MRKYFGLIIFIFLTFTVCSSSLSNTVFIRRAAAPPAGITYKGVAQNFNAASASTIDTSTTLNLAAGDTVVIGKAGNGVASSVNCGSDSSETYVNQVSSGGSYPASIWVLENVSANASATCTVTWAGPVDYRLIIAAQFSGLAISSSVDQTSCNVAACNALTSAGTTRILQDVSTDTADEVLVAFFVGWDYNQTLTGNGFTIIGTNDGSTNYHMAYKIVSSTGTLPGAKVADSDTSDSYMGLLVTLRAAP